MDFRFHNELTVPFGNIGLKGELIIPSKAEAVVIFSHGSGSSRFSPRNRMVADFLHQNNIGTFLFDLLTEREDQEFTNRFDIELLTGRLMAATTWLEEREVMKGCRIGFFGASTGAASALRASSILPQIGAVVSRGGRPDLAMDFLHRVKAPTLLIVGGLDHDVLQLNRTAYFQLACEKEFKIVKGASHLFEEPGAMQKVCEHAADWFQKYLEPVKITN
ncbi:MAG TPA: dienelactone hydrolase family protein [Chitinophagaceae bacterium]